MRFWEGLATMLLSPQTKSLLDNLPTSQGMYKHMVEKGKARRIMDSQHMSRRVAFFFLPWLMVSAAWRFRRQKVLQQSLVAMSCTWRLSEPKSGLGGKGRT